ncbi:MAG: NUDIX domain-containing protein [Alphaproteobacteria bacterium]|nr:NUDIX domain-containing protein [Alphaproteobacteria bacterium]
MVKHQQPLIGAYLVLIENNKILLQKRKGGILDGQYSPVAGHTEEGETVIEAIIREAKEEANIILDAKDLKVKVVSQRPNAPYKGTPTDIIDFYILATSYKGKIQNNEPNKCYEFIFSPLDKLPTETISHVKKAIQAYLQNEDFIIC